MHHQRHVNIIVLVIAGLIVAGCAMPKIKLFSDETEPLREFVIQGTAAGRILVISISGFISDRPARGIFRDRPSLVQETVAQLRLAEKTANIRAVLLKIDSPGGTTTASDILYREIAAFKERTGLPVVAILMDVAASGGYYVALPADHIMAHPTAVTGSVGVIFLQPKIFGLMDKIGVDVVVSKSGPHKDMGSPFRTATDEESRMIQDLIDALGARFAARVAEHRRLDTKKMAEIRKARIYLAGAAEKLGLVDSIGYLTDAVDRARKLAGLEPDCRVVVYRRTENPNDNLYNATTNRHQGNAPSLMDLGILNDFSSLRPGFYYLWPAAAY